MFCLMYCGSPWPHRIGKLPFPRPQERAVSCLSRLHSCSYRLKHYASHRYAIRREHDCAPHCDPDVQHARMGTLRPVRGQYPDLLSHARHRTTLRQHSLANSPRHWTGVLHRVASLGRHERSPRSRSLFPEKPALDRISTHGAIGRLHRFSGHGTGRPERQRSRIGEAAWTPCLETPFFPASRAAFERIPIPTPRERAFSNAGTRFLCSFGKGRRDALAPRPA